jgi:hypothetical protein
MTSLRARIAALLITAIVSVVALATLAASTALGPPPPAAILEPLARQLQLVAALAEANPVALTQQGGVILNSPAAGDREDSASRYLVSALADLGPEREAMVSRRAGDVALTASVRLRDGNWLVTPLPNIKPPPDQWRILALWISLIAIGAGAVSLYAAWMVTRGPGARARLSRDPRHGAGAQPAVRAAEIGDGKPDAPDCRCRP